MTPLVSVVVPAFNEGTRLGASLKRITSYFRSQSIEFEIIVVSDGSTDETAAVARAGGDAVKLVELLRNQGKGAAVRNGVLESQGQHILFTDADLSTPIEQWIQIHEKLGEGYDVVIGSRAHAESNIEVRQPWYRERMGKIFNWILHCILPLKLKDTLCLLFIHPPAHGSEVSPAARNTLDFARIPRTSKLLICGLFQKDRVLAQDDIP